MPCNCKDKQNCTCKTGNLVSVNAEITGQSRRMDFDGRQILVVPVVALVAGVVNGALVTSAELQKYVSAWEGRPIPVNHPVINGMNVSANIPEVRQASVIGEFQRVQFVENKLVGELWIDVARAKAKGFESVYSRLEANEMMEVSTAYFADDDIKSGVFNGKQYNRAHINLRPDHLAVLPDDVGACSLGDGCGTHRNSNLFSQAVDKLNGLIANLTNRTTTEANAMKTKAELVNAIITHKGTQFTESDRATLEAMEEKTLTLILPKEEPKPNTNGDGNNTNTEKTNTNQGDDNANAPKLNAEQQAALDWAMNLHKGEKTRLVAELVANEKCKLSKEVLEGMTVEALQGVASMIGADYSHRGTPVTHGKGDKVEPLQSTPVVLAEMDSKKTGTDNGGK